MPTKTTLFVATLLTALLLFGCDKQRDHKTIDINQVDVFAKQAETGRWYTKELLVQGQQVFQLNCSSCHGQEAESIPDWKTPTPTGHYPPPPLNGSAHAWHHPLSVLTQVISGGGAPMGGVMPAWKGVLTEQEMLSAIAAFQHYWSDDIYERWLEIEKQSR